MSLSHLIILGIIALIVIPPEKLPELARQFAKLLFELKRSADQIVGELKQEALFKPEDVIDQNIKNKLSEIQNQLNNNVKNINQNLQTTANPATTNSDSSNTVSEMVPLAHEAHEPQQQSNETSGAPAKVDTKKE